MNTRHITVFLVVGMAAALFLTHTRPPHPLLTPLVGSPVAAAQTPGTQFIVVQKAPHIGDDDLWNRYQITVPQTNPPLDMHTVLLIDGKGINVSEQKPDAWAQSATFKYRLDTDDDDRVKNILVAQGLPVKKNLVTYRFTVAGSFGSISTNRTIRFQHGGPGEQTSLSGGESVTGAIGQKIVLENSMLADSDFSGSLDRLFTLEQQEQPEFAPETPRGLVHHVVVYVVFQPHVGPPVKENKTYASQYNPTGK